MHAIKGYLKYQYGEQKADTLLVGILREVMSESNYAAYKRRSTGNNVNIKRLVS